MSRRPQPSAPTDEAPHFWTPLTVLAWQDAADQSCPIGRRRDPARQYWTPPTLTPSTNTAVLAIMLQSNIPLVLAMECEDIWKLHCES
jgi:hypothetical protein